MQAAFENCPCGQLDYDVKTPSTAIWISILEADPLASIRPSDDWSKSWLHKHEGLSQSHIAISNSWPTEIVNIEIIHDSCYFRLVTWGSSMLHGNREVCISRFTFSLDSYEMNVVFVCDKIDWALPWKRYILHNISIYWEKHNYNFSCTQISVEHWVRCYLEADGKIVSSFISFIPYMIKALKR